MDVDVSKADRLMRIDIDVANDERWMRMDVT